ncbi:septal ring lytic transglycosylase RlpA family protein [Zeimonas arvi]|uniref:Endolytic peptidoglycan transglycosylase RlpA n=1 Tax=Zeimonas arvi TaxID=2498847 RepID=A0A5C8NT40_9BURK|nr:septal ring lytic transglycosylase RlpA family protein [Zeimonas arvi]TXL64172.1 septal ring lytic transglycosylase RlpA family protein [Zeimonas arvi]
MNRLPFIGRPALLAALAATLLLGACAGPRGPAGTSRGGPDASPGGAAGPAANCARRGGGYYLDDGPGCEPPPDLAAIPDAVPRPEPLLPRTARPYVVFGREYRPMARLEPYKARGVATWYGRRYHGNPTSSGERYDMYAMTAAHPTLPIPSYARVTNLRNGRSVVVRVNDRGPFLNDRLIDLSYTAAAKLGYIEAGSAQVEVELITEFGEAPAQPVAAAPLPVPAPVEPPVEPPVERLAMQVEPTPGSPVPQLDRGYWLQLGAFGSADNAGAALQRLSRQVSGLGAPIDVVADGGLYKLQAGPWPTREAAQAAAERVRASTDLQPFATRR